MSRVRVLKAYHAARTGVGLMSAMVSMTLMANVGTTSNVVPTLPTLTDSSTVSYRASKSTRLLDQATPNATSTSNPAMLNNSVGTSEVKAALTHSHIIDLKTNQTLTPEQLVNQLAGQDYVILGEFHDSKAQHKLAYWLLESLNRQRPQGSVLLEMMTVDQQPLIEQVAESAKTTSIDLNQLNQALAWQSSWDWRLYGGIVSHPIEHGYPLIATNLTKAEVTAMMKESLPIQGYDSTRPAIKALIQDSILANHNLDNASDEDMIVVNKMVEIQQHRDRRMAEKLLSAPTPSLLLTGNFHAQKAVGVPLHLADLQQGQRIKKQGAVVMMIDSLEDLKADTPTDSADYAWVITGD